MRGMCNEAHDRNSVDTVNIFSDGDEKRLDSPKSRGSKEDSPKSSTGERTRRTESKKLKKLKKAPEQTKKAKKFIVTAQFAHAFSYKSKFTLSRRRLDSFFF